jgi:flavin reductase (DIM6/NTAB) family NADH-FMN oxidoreductase RutF
MRIKRALSATVQWQPVGVRWPQEAVQVLLCSGATSEDVTNNNVIVSLKPLIVGIGHLTELRSVMEQRDALELKFVDRQLQKKIGSLGLEQLEEWHVASHHLVLFAVRDGTNRCAGWLRRAWDGAIYRYRALRKRPEGGLTLPPRAVEQTMIFYMCPRPVFLISVDDGEHSNIFPMDLLGPVGAELITLALRSTSPSVATIAATRRLAMSAIAVDACKIAYQLGAHHRKLQIDLNSLPFAVTRSQVFSLPIPSIALQVREVQILDVRQIGSHTLFVGHIVSQQDPPTAHQLFHTCGIYQQLRARASRAFQVPTSL